MNDHELLAELVTLKDWGDGMAPPPSMDAREYARRLPEAWAAARAAAALLAEWRQLEPGEQDLWHTFALRASTRSQKMRDAGYTRRPTWRSLPKDGDDEQDQAESADQAVQRPDGEALKEALQLGLECAEEAYNRLHQDTAGSPGYRLFYRGRLASASQAIAKIEAALALLP